MSARPARDPRLQTDEYGNTYLPADADELPRKRIIYQRADMITPSRPIWVWKGWILARVVNLVVGRQGSGKTSFIIWLLSTLTRGLALPGDVGRMPMNAAYLSLEESEDVVVARLSSAGADLTRIQVLGLLEDYDDEGRPFMRQWTLPRDVGALGELIDAESIDVVVVDGIGYSVSGDSHNYANVGSALSALAAEAARTNAAIIGIVHPPKGTSDPVTAAIGSTAWTSVPRVVMVLGLDPDDEAGGRRVVRVSKSNYKLPDTGYSFAIDGDDALEVGFVVDLRSSTVSAESLMAVAPTEDERSEQTEVATLLRSLTEDGPRTVEEIRKELARAGFDVSDKTLQRARKRAGLVVGAPKGFGSRRSYMRPEHVDTSASLDTGLSTGAGRNAAGTGSVSVDNGSADTPSSPSTVQTVSTLSLLDKEPLLSSVDTSRGTGRTVSALDGER